MYVLRCWQWTCRTVILLHALPELVTRDDFTVWQVHCKPAGRVLARDLHNKYSRYLTSCHLPITKQQVVLPPIVSQSAQQRQCLQHDLTGYVTNLCRFNNQSWRRHSLSLGMVCSSFFLFHFPTTTCARFSSVKQARSTRSFTQHTLPRTYVYSHYSIIFRKSDLQSKLDPSEILANTPVCERYRRPRSSQ